MIADKVSSSAKCGECIELSILGYSLIMQKRDVILTAVFSSLAALILVAGISAACYFFHKRRRKRDEEEEDSQEVTCRKMEEGQEKKSRINGFLTLKTPLISTKTLGDTLEVHHNPDFEINSYPQVDINEEGVERKDRRDHLILRSSLQLVSYSSSEDFSYDDSITYYLQHGRNGSITDLALITDLDERSLKDTTAKAPIRLGLIPEETHLWYQNLPISTTDTIERRPKPDVYEDSTDE
ncbi:unnamed protein product [Diabrotica balteata]|uniref:Uncharacterized protein n=1 Tax=Diabrotica balteata TaxID=107213 RepID=A0A9N9SXT4_DIABA|nr:unnamed protein product [Diabrotica balteata]